MTQLISTVVSPSDIAWFWFVAVLLGFFDIQMPRGDRICIAGVLDTVALIALGAIPAMAVCITSLFANACVEAVWSEREAKSGLNLSRPIALSAATIPSTAFMRSGMPASTALAIGGGCIALGLLVEFGWRQGFATGGARSLSRAFRGGMAQRGLLMLAQLSAGLLTVLVYPSMGPWSLLMTTALLLLIRQSFAMLEQIRQTFRMTVSVLVEAAEAESEAKAGHAERTARIAREIAGMCRLRPAQIERVSYAAMLHDIAEIGQPLAPSGHSSELLGDIPFFRSIGPVLRVCDGCDGADGVTAGDTACAFIVAIASDIDDLMNPLLQQTPSAVARLVLEPPVELKARVVSSAVRMGYRIPQVA